MGGNKPKEWKNGLFVPFFCVYSRNRYTRLVWCREVGCYWKISTLFGQYPLHGCRWAARDRWWPLSLRARVRAYIPGVLCFFCHICHRAAQPRWALSSIMFHFFWKTRDFFGKISDIFKETRDVFEKIRVVLVGMSRFFWGRSWFLEKKWLRW